MQAERWQKISGLFQAALGRDPGQRSAFLAEACAGDEALRSEVESLISSHRKASDFIESPVSKSRLETYLAVASDVT